jgi:hypothetical protein
MFDHDLILDKFNSLHHQAKNLLLRFKARVIDRCADITTKLLDSRSQCGLALLSLLLLFEGTQSHFKSPAFFSDSLSSLFEIVEFNHAGLIRINQSLAFSLKSDQSPFEPLLFLLLRCPIARFLALVVLLDEDLRVAQQLAHCLPYEFFNRFRQHCPIQTL